MPWVVTEVKATNRVEEVFCAVVPGAEAFALGGDLLTKNCPYRKDRALASMRDTDAPSWSMATMVDQLVRSKVPGVKGQAFVHRKLIPLSVVPIDGAPGQGSLFDEHGDCEGICEW